MIMSADIPKFEDLLDLPPSEDDVPKLIPVGSYLVTVKGLPEVGRSTVKDTPFRRFTYQIIDIGADVDEVEIEERGGVNQIIGKSVKDTYYITDDAIFRLNAMLENCLGDVEGKSRRELIDETPNCELGIYLRHRAATDGSDRMFLDVSRTFPAEKFVTLQKAA